MTTIAPETLRDSLARLALVSDDRDERARALTLLFLLRAAAEDGRVVELSPSPDTAETLVTVDEVASGAWLAELLPIPMSTIENVLVCAPELSVSFLRTGQGVLQAKKPHAAAAFVTRETPFEMPGMDLLVAAGLVDRA